MKIKILGLSTTLFLFLFLGIYSNVYAISINDGAEIRFANTLSVEHISDILYNDIRTDHPTIGNEPAYTFNEKLQVFLLFQVSPINSCIDIPTNGYVSINVVYVHNENYALCAGAEGELGFGDYRNPFISTGIGIFRQRDMVFNNRKYDNYGAVAEINCFFNIGYRDSIHLYFDFTPGGLANEGSSKPYLTLDTALGYKKIIPLFIRFFGDFTSNTTGFPDDGEYDYSYLYSFAFLHLQYYGENFGLSAGFSGVNQKYALETYNSTTKEIDSEDIDSLKARGGGATFYINNISSVINLFGEFHLLRIDDSDWISISKFGVKVYF